MYKILYGSGGWSERSINTRINTVIIYIVLFVNLFFVISAFDSKLFQVLMVIYICSIYLLIYHLIIRYKYIITENLYVINRISFFKTEKIDLNDNSTIIHLLIINESDGVFTQYLAVLGKNNSHCLIFITDINNFISKVLNKTNSDFWLERLSMTSLFISFQNFPDLWKPIHNYLFSKKTMPDNEKVLIKMISIFCGNLDIFFKGIQSIEDEKGKYIIPNDIREFFMIRTEENKIINTISC